MPTTPVPYSITVTTVPDSTPAPNTDAITHTPSPSTDGPSSASSCDNMDFEERFFLNTQFQNELVDNTLYIPDIIDVNQYIPYIHEVINVTPYTWEVMDNEVEQLPSNIQDQNHYSNFSLDALVDEAANTHLSK